MSRKPAWNGGSEVFHAAARPAAGREILDLASNKRPPRASGFSTVELLVVVAIIITVTAISVPTVNTLVTSAQLRGGMGDLSGLFQNARNVAVRQNTISKVHFQTSNNRQVAFVDWANCGSSGWCGLTTSAPQITLPAKFAQVSPPTGTAPAAMTASACGSSTTIDSTMTDDTYFNQMGVPCVYSNSTCSTAQAFVYYFNYTGTANNPSWAALCVSPAGRVKAWYWTGSAWTN